MAKQASLFLPAGLNNLSVTFTNADTTAKKTIFTAGSNDSDLMAVIAASDDTAVINLQVWITRSAVDYLLATVRIAIASGTDGAAPAIDILNATAFAGLPANSVGKRYIPLKTGDSVKVSCLATMTAAKTLYVSALGQDY